MQRLDQQQKIEHLQKALKACRMLFPVLLGFGSLMVAISAFPGASVQYLLDGLVLIAGASAFVGCGILARYKIKRLEGV